MTRVKIFSTLLLFVLSTYSLCAVDKAELEQRPLRAAVALPDGILILHANPAPQWTADGFRQDPAFYYFTGLENTVGAILAIDGRSGKPGSSCPPRLMVSARWCPKFCPVLKQHLNWGGPAIVPATVPELGR
jgi:hypothetical protein